MPNLPDSIDLLPADAPTTPVDGISATDFGVGQAASEAYRVADAARYAQRAQIRANVRQDTLAAAPIAGQVAGANEATTKQWMAGAGDVKPTDPNFVAKLQAVLNERNQRAYTADGLTPGVAAELQRQTGQHTVRMLNAAAQAQGDALAAPAMAQQQAQDDAAIGDGRVAYQTAFGKTWHALQQGYVVTPTSADDLLHATADAHDQAAQQALAATPDHLKPQMQVWLAQQRAVALGEVSPFALHVGDTQLLGTYSHQLDALANGVWQTPGSYDQARATLLANAAGVPAGVRQKYQDDGEAQLATSRIDGLIASGHADVADEEIKAGKFNSVLTPQELDRLGTKTGAAIRDKAPKSLDQALAQKDLERRAQLEAEALLTTGKSTGAISSSELSALPLEKQAEILTGWDQARRQFATVGAVRDMSNADLLAAANGPAPDPTSPDYQNQLMMRPAAQAELKARQADPAAWAMQSNGKGPTKGAGAAGVGIAEDRGAALAQMWTQVQNTPDGPARAAAAARYAKTMLATQQKAGIPAAARDLLPKPYVAGLAASLINAPPEGRLAAMQSISGLINALPAAFRLDDGSWASPRQMLSQALIAAHVPPMQMVALADFGADQGKLGAAVAAINDTTLKTPLPGAQTAQLKVAVKAAMAPYLSTIAALPGASQFTQTRLDLATLMAREGMASGLSAAAAASRAAKAWADGFHFVDGYRIPQTAIPAGLFVPHPTGVNINNVPIVTDGVGGIRVGASALLSQLTGNNGAMLRAPPGSTAGQYAQQITNTAKWQTAPDDSGLVLMTPHPGGTWDQVFDRYGRPISASWQQLYGQAWGHPSPFATPPPATPVAPNGAPVPAFSRAQAFNAVSRSIVTQESHGVDGLVSDQGAMGRMQVLPSTAAPYAQRLFGKPLDKHALQYDGVYNQKIGNAILADSVNKYGNTPGGLVLTIADYFAGPGHVDGYTDAKGYHPGFIQQFGDPRAPGANIDQWVEKLGAVAPKTQKYVRDVLPRAYTYFTQAR